MRVHIAEEVLKDYPDIELVVKTIGELEVAPQREDLEHRKREVEAHVREEGTADTIKDEPLVAAYRAFYWSLGIDPTKVRPAAEALVRRIVRGRDLPTINTAADSVNLASIETRVAFAAFDADLLHGDLTMRYARQGEPFVGIGMDRPRVLEGRELVFDDGVALVAIYPYRDADATKLTVGSRTLMLVGCGVPGLGGKELEEATARAAELVRRYARRP
jgi:DNA/RNA-binding domain of Phe-tRNA-synthetase-like protein